MYHDRNKSKFITNVSNSKLGISMNYQDFIVAALRGRTVNKASRDWDIPQSTLHNYCTGKRSPDYVTLIIMAREAGIDVGDAVKIVAGHEAKKKPISDRIKAFFQQPRKTLREPLLQI